MSEWTVYHNPRCSKSRATLEILRNKNIKPNVIEYLKTPLKKVDLKAIVKNLAEKSVRSIVRNNEAEFSELALADASDDQLLEAIVKYPVLLQRPIVLYENKAVVCRPAESVNQFF